MTTNLLDIGCTIKILSYISKSIIVALLRANGSRVSEVPALYLSTNRRTHRILGDFNPGVQPLGTPITAEVVHGGDVNINVIWRDARGHAVTSSWSKSSGWDLPNSNRLGGRASLNGREWGIFDTYIFLHILNTSKLRNWYMRMSPPQWQGFCF